MRLTGYDRDAAVSYAHKWAFARNPRYFNYDALGGDCTNFASQCLYAGSGIMNYTPTFGWYYTDANRKAHECTPDQLMPGDLVQLSFTGGEFQHSPVVVAVSPPFRPEDILIAAHTFDADYRPVSTYDYQSIRFLHIEGVYRP